MVYADLNNDGTINPANEIVEENNYYPFGLKHEGYNNLPGDGYKYKLNGKEYEDSFGLNIYEMDMRQLDPAIGRWVVQDPVTHHEFSPYSAFDNNPVYWSDPSGANSVRYNWGAKNYDVLDKDGKWVGNFGADMLESYLNNPEEFLQNFFSLEASTDEANGGGGGNGNGGIKGKGGKYDGRDLSSIKSHHKETLFSFDLLFYKKMTHKETIELFDILASRKDMFDDIMDYIGYTGFLPGTDIKGLLGDLKKGNPSKVAVGLLIETFKKKVDKVSDSNIEILNSYLKLHYNNPSNMNGVYQIYEKNGSKMIPYGNLSVHYYDVYSGKHLGTVE